MTGILFQGGLFFGSLLLMSAFSFFLTVALEWIGVSVHLSDGLLGIVAAPGADAPEISSAITALSTGHHDLDLGVVLGYNIFDLAALLGLSAIPVGTVRLRKAVALLNWRGGLRRGGGIFLVAVYLAFAAAILWPPRILRASAPTHGSISPSGHAGSSALTAETRRLFAGAKEKNKDQHKRRDAYHIGRDLMGKGGYGAT